MESAEEGFPHIDKKTSTSVGSKCCLLLMTTLEPSDWGQNSSDQKKNENEEDSQETRKREDLVFRLQKCCLFVMRPPQN